MRFSPVVDGVLLKETPFEAYTGGRQHPVPVLAGYNLGETRGFMQRWSVLPKTLSEFKAFAKKYGPFEERFLSLCSVETDEDVKALFNSDAFTGMIIGNRIFGYLMNAYGRNAYLYEFDPDIPGDDNAGSYHGCELWFAYDSLARCWRPFTGKHYDLARQTSSYWVNFVTNGDPNGTDTIGEPLPQWKPFTEENQFVMGFHDVPSENHTVTDPIMKFRMDFTLGKL